MFADQYLDTFISISSNVFPSDSFLQTCGNSTSATTWHSYSFNGRIATADNFTDPEIMDVFKQQIKKVQSIIRKYRPFLPKQWIGETSGGWGGGTRGLSDAYAGGFMYVDDSICLFQKICISYRYTHP